MRIALPVLFLLVAVSAGLYIAYTPGMSEDQKSATALVEKVQELYSSSGEDNTFEAINTLKADLKKGTIYPFIIRTDGTVVAHPSPKIRGTIARDGKYIQGKQILNKITGVISSKGKGWVNYDFPHPKDGKLTAKVTYVEPIGDKYVVGAGYYVR